MIVRNGLRSVAYGYGQSGLLDVRFIAAKADIQKGDVLTIARIAGVMAAKRTSELIPLCHPLPVRWRSPHPASR